MSFHFRLHPAKSKKKKTKKKQQNKTKQKTNKTKQKQKTHKKPPQKKHLFFGPFFEHFRANRNFS